MPSVLLAWFGLLALAYAEDKVVQVSMEASWTDSGIAAEAAMFFGANCPAAFWKLFESEIPQNENDEYSLVLDLADLCPSSRPLLDFALASRHYTAEVAANMQISASAPSACPDSFFEGQIAPSCSPEAVMPQSWDFCQGPLSQASPILYSRPGPHNKKHAAGQSICWRPLGSGTRPVVLQGYGVSMALKSMEYKTVDDTKVTQHGNATASVAEKDLAGFYFDTLKRRKPELVADLNLFQAHLAGTAVRFDQLKVWQLQDLGLQATQRILDSDRPLDAAVELCSNFLDHAGSLARMKVNPSVKKDYDKPQPELLLVNGRPVPAEQRDAFSIFSVLEEETRSVRSLTQCGLTVEQSTRLLGVGMDEVPALTFRHPAPLWVNDLAKDQHYGRFAQGLQAYLQPQWPGQMYFVRQNLFSAVYVVDVGTTEGVQLASTVIQAVQNMYPIRFGFLFRNLNNEHSRAVAKCYKYLSDQFDARTAAALFGEQLGPGQDLEDAMMRIVNRNLRGRLPSILSELEPWARETQELSEKAGYDVSQNLLLLNGRIVEAGANPIQSLASATFTQLPVLQEAITNGLIKQTKGDLLEQIWSKWDAAAVFTPLLTLPRQPVNLASPPLAGLSYLHAGSQAAKVSTLVLAVDTSNPADNSAVAAGLAWVQAQPSRQLSLLFSQATHTARALLIAATLPPGQALSVSQRLLSLTSPQQFLEIPVIAQHWQDPAYEAVLASHATWLAANPTTVIFNGLRITAPARIRLDSVVMGILERSETLPVRSVVAEYENLGLPAQCLLPVLQQARNGPARQRGPTSPAIKVDGDGMQLTAVLDPLSQSAQRLLPLIQALHRIARVSVRLHLSPNPRLSDLPLKTFYQYALAPVEFEVGRRVQPSVVFTRLPADRLLTAALEVPDAWLVEAKEAVYDMDNIKLADSDSSVYARYSLRSLLVEGRCMDTTLGQPPRGLELKLIDRAGATRHETIVMQNYGYFQLQAAPGSFEVALAGPGLATYGPVRVPAVVRSLLGLPLTLTVTRRPGHHQDTLVDEASAAAAEKDNTIHVFSLASGHLYERFLKIMMLSVVKKTSNPVKFWFLENYASPAMKREAPVLAKELGASVNFVTYKWPHWLNQQTEKQRIIWGYKILFLDVLFPLNVTKIIYVDSDQVVRADLAELKDMDLKGAVYGYTPFCQPPDNRPETEGFRFWASGYWKDHLRTKPYHISALYVVDLFKFRRRGTGDTLRATYDSLSQDPNSLANLDQDLPNYLQPNIPIHSLPQEWLWCQTWCSDDSKARAKTIDLCNNPLTKIPKLENALRQVEEWPDLDNEVKVRLAQALERHQHDEL